MSFYYIFVYYDLERIGSCVKKKLVFSHASNGNIDHLPSIKQKTDQIKCLLVNKDTTDIVESLKAGT